jgi:hypothetical protein
MWLPFPVSLKLKLIFLKSRDLVSFSGVAAKAKAKLIFLKSRSGFGTKNLASFFSVALSAKNLASFSVVALARPFYQTQKQR